MPDLKKERPVSSEPNDQVTNSGSKVALNPDFENDLGKKQAKWRTQEKRVYESLYKSPKTRLQLSHYENIPIQNVCRYIGNLRKLGNICVVRIDRDPLSGMKSEYLSTNPALCPKPEPATKILRNGQISFFL